MPKIHVHEKALAHLSRGLYRSPASALRELVSNGWDANAKTVRITTDFPRFYQLAVEDNGDGFTSKEFIRLMGGGIGNSDKRPRGDALIDGRTAIGRLGIGMLGIAQICGSFTITSKMADGSAFRAHIKLYDFLKQQLDEESSIDTVDVGIYELDDEFDKASTRVGTSITSQDVHPAFVRAFQQSLDAPSYQPPPQTWEEVVHATSQVRTLQEMGDYWRLLWELSAACPVPYLSASCVPRRLVAKEQERLESYNFRLIVDGLELRKPVFLEGNPGGYTSTLIPEQHFTPYGKDVRFHGYIVVQEGSQLKPDELRGILVRIRNVAIGYYDPSMLDYRFNEGPRSRWLTGEIYVTEGLEDALNIDRDSFNRFHPQFRVIQEYLHKLLRENVFPKVYKQISVRSSARAEVKQEKRTDTLIDVLGSVSGLKVVMTKSEDDDITVKPVKRAGELRVDIPAAQTLRTRKSNRQLASSILALFELAETEEDPDSKRQVFKESLLSLLARW